MEGVSRGDGSDALYVGITGGLSRADEGTDPYSMVADVMAATGWSPKAAAAFAGIPYSTFGHIRRGRAPSARNFGRLRDAQRRARLTPDRERMLRGRPHIGVQADVVISQDSRDGRKMLVSGWPPRKRGHRSVNDTFPEVLDLWLARRDREASALFTAAIDAGVDGDMAMSNITHVTFFESRGEALAWLRTS